MNGENPCPEFREWQKWFENEFTPALAKFAAHFVDCPICRELILSQKDGIGLDILSMSEEELLKRAKKLKEITR